MPFKHTAARRHHIRRARYRVTNWAAYEAALRRRGDLMFWVDDAALAGWQAPRRSTPGGQPRYSDLAIELVLTLQLVFHLALRPAEGFAHSVLPLLGLGLGVPDHTTLSRRGRAFAGRQPRVRAGTGPMHLMLDSTGLELFGQGEWCAAKHGRLRRRWLKLHISVDASTGEIAAHVLTKEDGDDAAQAPDLLRQCEGTLASLNGQPRPHRLAAGDRIRQTQPRRDHHEPLQAPHRAQAPCAHPARSGRRGRARRPGAQPHDPHRQAGIYPPLSRLDGGLRCRCWGPCTNAAASKTRGIDCVRSLGAT